MVSYLKDIEPKAEQDILCYFEVEDKKNTDEDVKSVVCEASLLAVSGDYGKGFLDHFLVPAFGLSAGLVAHVGVQKKSGCWDPTCAHDVDLMLYLQKRQDPYLLFGRVVPELVRGKGELKPVEVPIFVHLKAYREQIRRGRKFLHEQTHDEIEKDAELSAFIFEEGIHLVRGPMCQFLSPEGHFKKKISWITNSEVLAASLRECHGREIERQLNLTGTYRQFGLGRFPARFVAEVIRSVKHEMKF
jgi:hypothetical protein